MVNLVRGTNYRSQLYGFPKENLFDISCPHLRLRPSLPAPPVATLTKYREYGKIYWIPAKLLKLCNSIGDPYAFFFLFTLYC